MCIRDSDGVVVRTSDDREGRERVRRDSSDARAARQRGAQRRRGGDLRRGDPGQGPPAVAD
eukprot:899098-Pyramimonas_sp.AAC.1